MCNTKCLHAIDMRQNLSSWILSLEAELKLKWGTLPASEPCLFGDQKPGVENTYIRGLIRSHSLGTVENFDQAMAPDLLEMKCVGVFQRL